MSEGSACYPPSCRDWDLLGNRGSGVGGTRKFIQEGKTYLPAPRRPVFLSAFRQRAEGTLAKAKWP
jgi:hypothetical protein